MASNRYLLDTNVFIWAMEENKRLPRSVKDKIADPKNLILISVASVWEIVIKRAKHTLNVPKDIEGGIRKSNFGILPIQISHIMELEKIANHHKDPFDRILIAQAKSENLTLITTDAKIKKYDVKVL